MKSSISIAFEIEETARKKNSSVDLKPSFTFPSAKENFDIVALSKIVSYFYTLESMPTFLSFLRISKRFKKVTENVFDKLPDLIHIDSNTTQNSFYSFSFNIAYAWKQASKLQRIKFLSLLNHYQQKNWKFDIYNSLVIHPPTSGLRAYFYSEEAADLDEQNELIKNKSILRYLNNNSSPPPKNCDHPNTHGLDSQTEALKEILNKNLSAFSYQKLIHLIIFQGKSPSLFTTFTNNHFNALQQGLLLEDIQNLSDKIPLNALMTRAYKEGITGKNLAELNSDSAKAFHKKCSKDFANIKHRSLTDFPNTTCCKVTTFVCECPTLCINNCISGPILGSILCLPVCIYSIFHGCCSSDASPTRTTMCNFLENLFCCQADYTLSFLDSDERAFIRWIQGMENDPPESFEGSDLHRKVIEHIQKQKEIAAKELIDTKTGHDKAGITLDNYANQTTYESPSWTDYLFNCHRLGYQKLNQNQSNAVKRKMNSISSMDRNS